MACSDACSARVVLEPPKREHVLEALFGDDRFHVVLATLAGVVTHAGFPGVVCDASVAVWLVTPAALGLPTPLDGAQKRKRVCLGLGVRGVMPAPLGTFGALCGRRVAGGLARRCALARSSLFAVFLLRHASVL